MKTDFRLIILLLSGMLLPFSCQKQDNKGYSPAKAGGANYNYYAYHAQAAKGSDVLPPDLFSNQVIDSILSGRGLAYLDTTIMVYKDTVNRAYVYNRKLTAYEGVSRDLFFVATNNNMSSLAVFSETRVLENGNRQCTFTNLANTSYAITVIVDSSGHVVSVNGAQTSVGGSGGSQPCSQTTSTYKDCFKCAWGQLTDEAFGTLTCSVNPVMCLMACGISCAMFPGPSQGNDPYTYAQVKSLAYDLVNNGKYSGFGQCIGQKSFLLLY